MATEHPLSSQAKNRGKSVRLQNVIDHLEHDIVSSSIRNDKKNICLISKGSGGFVTNVNTEPSEATTSEAEGTSSSSSSSPSLSSSLSSSSTSLAAFKTKLTAADKVTLTEKLQNFNKLHKDYFWVLDATMRQAEVDDVEPISVEEKVMAFASQCEYYHLSQSLILDLGDKNWSSVFNEEQLDEIRGAGGDLPCGVPKELEQCFESLKELKTGAEVFKYARSIEITDPTKETLKVWLSTELQKVASLFLETGTFDIGSLMESDQLYRCFDFFATVFKGSSILAKGTEKSSEANATSVNQDRTLSAIKLIANRKMERRVDMLFNCGHIEFGCTEIGATKDQTKEMRDSFLKMPIKNRPTSGG
ncbi:hypothetical protein BDB00DRAFT_873580 [Zychaea mexicana]|uniref:uncharacterized protein n=1 Tax=Zychaea mexicana TaxID=64656 RepID=UPI0022FEC8D3|nr:uncharacterized protein BDB00DRAFT_873574 [Zychaea mexicana]XP_052978580.1 uncharacterized protein BDB00DRAFT_873580 [Zychaea mexicana]KAI9492311.1 hypothetical protein BDB00DRAFT_873574 [Zychaea mexicana]KAI9492315.1 hypothetical protein BDB00DRAFT_873580 [Zychaea mexicana]